NAAVEVGVAVAVTVDGQVMAIAVEVPADTPAGGITRMWTPVTGGLQRIPSTSTAVVVGDSALTVVADVTTRAGGGPSTSIPVEAETRTGMAASLAAARVAPGDVDAVVAGVADFSGGDHPSQKSHGCNDQWS
ncbi:unnamed protein product, partial [Ectocarpus sp. 12 AP-2014]